MYEEIDMSVDEAKDLPGSKEVEQNSLFLPLWERDVCMYTKFSG